MVSALSDPMGKRFELPTTGVQIASDGACPPTPAAGIAKDNATGVGQEGSGSWDAPSSPDGACERHAGLGQKVDHMTEMLAKCVEESIAAYGEE